MTTSESNSSYTSTTQQRVLRTLKALFGFEITGITTQDLAKRLEMSSSKTFKDLKNLEEAGFAEQLQNKKWRVSPNLGKEALKILKHIDEHQKYFDDVVNRYIGDNK